MYKKVVGLLVPAVAGLMLASTVHAQSYASSYWGAQIPAGQGVAKISLSGECSGSITVDVGSVSVSGSYPFDEQGNALSDYRFSISVSPVSGNFSFSGGTSGQVAGELFTEAFNKGKVKQVFTLADRGSYGINLGVLSDSRYDAALRCKSGKAFREQEDYSPYIYYNSPTHAQKTTVQLAYDVANIDSGAKLVLKSQIKGSLPSRKKCVNKGSVVSDKYSVSCQALKPVHVKVSISAKATAYSAY